MASEYEPRCLAPVHGLEVATEELVLGGGGVEEVFRAHQHKVGTAVVKAIPKRMVWRIKYYVIMLP